MATLTPTLTLASTDVSANETLNISVTDALEVLGQAYNFQVIATQTGTVFATAANYTKSYVFLKNTSSTAAEIMTIEKADGSDEYFELAPGEFAFFPWAASENLALDAASGSPVLEVRIWQAAAA